jgi:hypothetical protein
MTTVEKEKEEKQKTSCGGGDDSRWRGWCLTQSQLWRWSCVFLDDDSGDETKMSDGDWVALVSDLNVLLCAFDRSIRVRPLLQSEDTRYLLGERLPHLLDCDDDDHRRSDENGTMKVRDKHLVSRLSELVHTHRLKTMTSFVLSTAAVVDSDDGSDDDDDDDE